jgi:perosamine synthetase|tara:strand:+ start:2252 stop:3361 length:1110 start_codon:yes stop_codon:yes gene_type:complete
MDLRQDVLPVLRPLGGEEESNALKEVIESGWWGKGKKVSELEEKFAKLVGAKHAIAVTSNTHGLDLVLKAKGIEHGDVISPTMSFATTAMAPLWNNCSSTLVDVKEDDLCIDPDDVKSNLKTNTKAVIAVNMAGVPADIDSIRNIFDGFVIEDCAHSCYTSGAGSKGDVAIWSFQAVKTMPCGDGGMITTNDTALYEKLVPMSWMGISSTHERTKNIDGRPGYSWDYDITMIGTKSYMIDIMAAICLEQLKKLEGNLAIRRGIQNYYNNVLPSEVQRPVWSNTVQHYGARVEASLRDELIDYLASKKIHTSVHYKPLHLHTLFKGQNALPVAEKEWQRLISLPCHPAMSGDDMGYVAYWLRRFMNEHSL